MFKYISCNFLCKHGNQEHFSQWIIVCIAMISLLLAAGPRLSIFTLFCSGFQTAARNWGEESVLVGISGKGERLCASVVPPSASYTINSVWGGINAHKSNQCVQAFTNFKGFIYKHFFRDC